MLKTFRVREEMIICVCLKTSTRKFKNIDCGLQLIFSDYVFTLPRRNVFELRQVFYFNKHGQVLKVLFKKLRLYSNSELSDKYKTNFKLLTSCLTIYMTQRHLWRNIKMKTCSRAYRDAPQLGQFGKVLWFLQAKPETLSLFTFQLFPKKLIYLQISL